MTSHKSSNGRMRDYCDSKDFNEHPIFSAEPNALQIQLYYDDIDVCNAIGSKSVIHTLGNLHNVNTYCSLANCLHQVSFTIPLPTLILLCDQHFV